MLYIYDTNSAVVMSADTGNGGGTTAQDMIGWVVPQSTPGAWPVGDFAASYFMSDVSNGDYNGDLESNILTLNNSGLFTAFASDSGGQNWASWDEPMSGSSSQTATDALVPDTTFDPTGTLGVFDATGTQGTTTTTQAYCIAVSVDKATNSNGQGRLVCVNASDKSPKINLISESD